MRILWTAIAAALLVTTAAPETGDPPLPGLHVHVRRPIVNRGGTIQARVAWETGGGFFVAGEFTARWQLRSATGDVVAHGRRPVHIGYGEDPPYRFSVSARAPRRVNWDQLTLEVALIDDPTWDYPGSTWARGEASVAVEPGRAYYWNGEERESYTGTLVARYGVGLRIDGEDPYYALGLLGPGESAIRANPAWEGSRVTVTGRAFEGTCCAYFPEDPGSLLVETVEWLDPLPDPLYWVAAADGVVPARLPPPEVIGEVNWARFARESRAPVVVESAAEMDALREDLGTAYFGGYDPLAGYSGFDFEANRVVVVFAGVSPDPAWFVRVDSIVFDPAGVRTIVGYSAVAPAGRFSRGFHWVEPYAAVVLPRRDGPVEFVRHEWIPELPPWW
jgi:hypothetical protein